MSDATDWLSALGGAVGAIGGPAGLWAAWSVHRQNQRRRFGPPPELVGLLAKLIDITKNAPITYRDAAWFDAAEAGKTIGRIEELGHLVTRGTLRAQLALAVTLSESMISAVTHDWNSAEQRVGIVARQVRSAEKAQAAATNALASLRRAL
ncbi:hypothetical protein ACIOHE_14945 [Streptomyces sp. NPDC087851]|uniref:hypothetical protein n=1 Tax=Streptomyces sp. NPDC087851 TaxID=3365810 RepID=UPI003813090F